MRLHGSNAYIGVLCPPSLPRRGCHQQSYLPCLKKLTEPLHYSRKHGIQVESLGNTFNALDAVMCYRAFLVLLKLSQFDGLDPCPVYLALG